MPDPNERYRELLGEQIELRSQHSPDVDIEGVKAVLRERQDEFDGYLVVLVANDFGKPVAFLPEAAGDYSTVLNAVLDEIHEEKWSAEHDGLRAVRNQLFEAVDSLHKVLPALYFEDGSAEYDIAPGRDQAYNFVTIRQVVGLVDWIANAQDITERY